MRILDRLHSVAHIGIGTLVLLLLSGCAAATSQASLPQYYSPLSGAQYVSSGATIIVRYGPTLDPQQVSLLQFKVQGSESGDHSGKTVLADDEKTVIFKPDRPFAQGERVQVDVSPFDPSAATTFDALSYSFTVSVHQESGSPGGTSAAATVPLASAFPNFLTVPQDIPHFTVSQASAPNDEGDIFVAPL